MPLWLLILRLISSFFYLNFISSLVSFLSSGGFCEQLCRTQYKSKPRVFFSLAHLKRLEKSKCVYSFRHNKTVFDFIVKIFLILLSLELLVSYNIRTNEKSFCLVFIIYFDILLFFKKDFVSITKPLIRIYLKGELISSKNFFQSSSIILRITISNPKTVLLYILRFSSSRSTK
jgi:hypothetical protein